MLQLISFDSRHFTQPELSIGWSDLHEIKALAFATRGHPHGDIIEEYGHAMTPLGIRKDRGNLQIETALHSLKCVRN